MNTIIIPKQELIIPTGKVLAILRDIRTGRVHETMTDNMVVTAGKNAMAERLIGTTNNNKGIINYCALGTGITAPAPGDVALQTEIFRKLISVRSVTGNVATFQTFFTASEVVGALREAALFGDDANSLSGSGTLFCKTLINRTKTINDTLTLLWAVTVG